MQTDELVVALLRQMFAAYNQPCSPERLAMYVEVIGSPDPSALREAIRDAMAESGEFAPGPGTVKRHLRAVTRTRPGDPESPPGGRQSDGQRGLPAGQAIGRIMAGAARRTQGMVPVFRRAREIRAAGLVPPDLWGRFASEVMAELELDPYAEVSEQMRRCMAHARQWREERGLSWDPEIERAFRAGAAS